MDILVGSVVAFFVAILIGILFGRLLVAMAKRSLVRAQREKLDVARVALEIIMGRVVPKDQGMWKVTAEAPYTLRLELLSTLAMNETQQDQLNRLIFTLINNHKLAVQVVLVDTLSPAQ